MNTRTTATPIATRTRLLTDHCGMKRAMRFTALFSEISIVPDGQPVRTNDNRCTGLPPAGEQPARARVILGDADVDEAGARAVGGEAAGGREPGEERRLERKRLGRLRDLAQGGGAEDVESAVDPSRAFGSLLLEGGHARPCEAHRAEARALRDARHRQRRGRPLDAMEADQLVDGNRKEGVAIQREDGGANRIAPRRMPQRAARA